MWPPCSLLVTLILILLSSSYVASIIDPLEKIVIANTCPAEPLCKTLETRDGIVQLKFDSFYPSFFHCAIIFVVKPYNRKVFLHILSQPEDCDGYRVRVYNDYVLIPSNEFTLQTRNFCQKTVEDRSSGHYHPRSFATSTSYFTIQVEYKCREKLFRPLDFMLYYQSYLREEELIRGICEQCQNESYPFNPGSSICANLRNCSGIQPSLYQLKRANLSGYEEADGKKKGPKATEIFGILLAGAIVLTILVVAFHCGGQQGTQGSRGRGMTNGTGPGTGASHAFGTSTSSARMKGPVVHV